MAGIKILLSCVLIVLMFLVFKGQSHAATPPTFPSCANPQGTVISSNSTVPHGVPGNSNSFNGTDAVFRIGEDTIVQCLCPSNGAGIQSNWWKINGLTQAEIQVFQSQGWILVSDGAAWGLPAGPYLVQNVAFSCPGGGNGGGPGDGRSDGRSDGRGGGSVLGAATGSVLGLATTGNSAFILGVFLIGVTLFFSGLILNHR